MTTKINSRTPNLDMDKCLKNFTGNRFDLVIYASALARQISRKNRENVEYRNATVDALFEIQESKHGQKT